MIFHTSVIIILLVATGLSLWQATLTNVGLVFMLYLLPSLSALGLIPFLVYRAYALRSATYTIERDGIHLRWGLRIEQIPMDSILWILPASEISEQLPLPVLRWPGSILGLRNSPTTGTIEFMASSSRDLILISTSDHAYAVSPAEPIEFMRAFRRSSEMGSLQPIPSISIYPLSFLQRVWKSRPAKILLLSGFVVCLFQIVWVSLSIPARPQVFLGFQLDGTPGDLVPSVRLFLLPLINTAFFLTDLLIGFYLYQNEENQPLAYLVWGSGVLISLLFIGGVFFTLRAGGI